MRLAIAEINLQALAHNLAQVRQFAPNSKVMAVLKANAYGHGLVKIAQHLNDADAFAVARIDEALALRAGGLTKPIVLLEGFFHQDDLPILLANNFQTIIHDENQLRALENAKLDAPISCWLKINTGMHRLGVAPTQLNDFYQRLQATDNAKDTINLMTHFSSADDVNDPKTAEQIALFDSLAINTLIKCSSLINYNMLLKRLKIRMAMSIKQRKVTYLLCHIFHSLLSGLEGHDDKVHSYAYFQALSQALHTTYRIS